MMRLAAVGVATALCVRVVRSRHHRVLHPAGRSFNGELEIWGTTRPIGAELLDRPGRYPVTVRVSKGAGTRGDRPDVLGLAIRVYGPGADLLLSTAGTGRWTRHLPVPRRSFGARYGTITSYRTGADHKVYLAAGADPDGPPLGRTLDEVAALAGTGRARMLLHAGSDTVGRVTFGTPLSPGVDAALAFDPVRNATADLRPSGTIHGSRALAYRLSQRWRGVPPRHPAPR